MHVKVFAPCLAWVAIGLAAGCNTLQTRLRERAELVAALDSVTRSKVERGIIEPGFTPQLVYLALGQPTSPVNAQIDATREGTWLYRDFKRNDRDFIRAGFRQRVVFDPVRRSDVVIIEPVDPKQYPQLTEKTLRVTFRDGRVVNIERGTL